MTRAKVGQVPFVKDPAARVLFEELFRLIQQRQLDLSAADQKALAAQLGSMFADGEIESLNRVLDGRKIAEQILSRQTGTSRYAGWFVKQAPATTALAALFCSQSANETEALRVEQAGTGRGIAVSAVRGSAPGIEIIQNGGGGNAIEASSGARLTAGGVWTDASSAKLKKFLNHVDDEDALTTIEELDISDYVYRAAPGERHCGTSAEQFYAVTGYGSNRDISGKDVAFVAMRALQAALGRISQLEGVMKSLLDFLKLRAYVYPKKKAKKPCRSREASTGAGETPA